MRLLHITPLSAALITFFSIIGIVWLLTHSESQRFLQEQRTDVLNRISVLRANLESALNRRILLAHGMAAHIAHYGNISETDYTALASLLTEREAGILNFGYMHGNTILYAYPLEPNKKTIGVDMRTLPEQWKNIEHTIAIRRTTVYGPMKLIQGGIGFISRTPVFARATHPQNPYNIGEFIGIVSIVMLRDTLFKEAGLLDGRLPLRFTLRGYDGEGEKGNIFYGEQEILTEKPLSLNINLPDGAQWQIAAIPREGWQTYNSTALWFWGIGSCFALAAAFLVWYLVNMPLRLQQAVISATTALRHSEANLKAINETLELRVFQRTTELATAHGEIMCLNEQLRRENRRMSNELEITRRLQQMLLPKAEKINEIKSLDIATYLESANEVSGDYYDILCYENTIRIGIGDITGHGLESGVLMLMVQTAIRTLLVNQVNEPEDCLNILNTAIYDSIQRMEIDKNLTLLLLDYRLNPELINSGLIKLTGQHEDVLVMRKNGELECIDTNELGFLIGVEYNIKQWIKSVNIVLQPGDGIVLYTDGLIEALNAQKRPYGLKRLCQVVKNHWQSDAEGIKNAVIKDLQRHLGSCRILDDVTLLVLKQKYCDVV